MFAKLSRANRLTCLLCFYFLLGLNFAFSQKQDYVWLSGYGSGFGVDSPSNIMFGTSVLDFNYSPRQVRFDTLKMNFSWANTSYCDSNGVLQFYTNGIYIANALDNKIENSDTLNAGYYLSELNTVAQTQGYVTHEGVLALEDPANKNSYYLIHSCIDSFQISQGLNIFCKYVYSTYLDMNANAGHGKVISKNQIILLGIYGYEIKATRHANGRDWWILVQKRNTNCYERILLNPTGLHVLSLTCGGQAMGGLTGSACFSQDGSKYVYASLQQGISLFDFDRCTGELSNPLYKPLPIFTDSGLIGIGTAFSPNNRFLYVNATIHCYQFDLWANDVWASIDTVARYDGAANPFASVFNTMQIAPDGKIYSSCGNGESVYHIIDRSDEKGDSCLFIQHGVHLPSYSIGLPNFVNYRLGALTGSACDTLNAINDIAEKEKVIKVFPNPATNYIMVDYGFTDWNRGSIDLEIINELGQIVYSQKLPMYSGFQKINVKELPNGHYQIFVKRNREIVADSKFIKN